MFLLVFTNVVLLVLIDYIWFTAVYYYSSTLIISFFFYHNYYINSVFLRYFFSLIRSCFFLIFYVNHYTFTFFHSFLLSYFSFLFFLLLFSVLSVFYWFNSLVRVLNMQTRYQILSNIIQHNISEKTSLHYRYKMLFLFLLTNLLEFMNYFENVCLKSFNTSVDLLVDRVIVTWQRHLYVFFSDIWISNIHVLYIMNRSHHQDLYSRITSTS